MVSKINVASNIPHWKKIIAHVLMKYKLFLRIMRVQNSSIYISCVCLKYEYPDRTVKSNCKITTRIEYAIKIFFYV